MFSAGNLLSTLFVWPLISLIEWNFLVSVRKTLFICAYGQLRDLLTEYQRFYKLYPDHLSSRAKAEGDRIKHPSEDTRKKLQSRKNTRASLERRQ